MRARTRSLLADTRGVSTLEFALIFPILLMIYVGLLHLADLSMARNKVSRAASTLAAGASLSPTLSDTRLAMLMAAAASVLDPLESEPQIVLTSIVTSDSGASVAWSDAVHASALQAGSTLPSAADALGASGGESLVMAEISLPYSSRFARMWNALAFVPGSLTIITVLQDRAYAVPSPSAGRITREP